MKNNKRSILILLTGLAILQFGGCSFSDSPLFKSVSPNKSGISFQNRVIETDERNMLTFEYIYNGAGVATGDFNNDGFTDIYFVGNETNNALYLNKGDFEFEDVSVESGTIGSSEKWYSGASIVDINADGLMDLYLSVTGSEVAELRKNELFINMGVNDDGIPVFEESSQIYGLDDSSYSTHAAFFDYDNDGILDIYLLVANSNSGASYTNTFQQMGQQNTGNTDKLFKGTWDEQLGHPVYKEVSEISGINKEGYGLGVNILDINMDGYKDVYVTNDYASEDLFWINNKDGTFTNRIADMLNHTSYSAMGSDVADINNDGLLDLFSLDMLPDVNVRAKMMANPSNYRNYVNEVFDNSFPQFTKNTLQLNMGSVHSDQLPVFSEIAAFANVEATDWSWSALLADFNNSGSRDLFITNGIPRDITDKDFWSEYGRVRDVMPMNMALSKIPQVPAPNYIYENNSDLTFTNRSNQWGFNEPGYSTGSAYADLDNDGDLDLVVNNTNSEAGIYRNNTIESDTAEKSNWLKVKLTGTKRNSNGLGTVLDLYFADGSHQKHEQSMYRGYLSSVDPLLQFGTGEETVLDSLKISYHLGNSRYEKTLYQVETNQVLDVDLTSLEPKREEGQSKKTPNYKLITDELIPPGTFAAPDFNDFAENPMLLYKISERGPASAAGDISGNGLDDIFVGPVGTQPGYILYQQESGKFNREWIDSQWVTEHPGVVVNDAELIDINGDGFLDLYLAVAALVTDISKNHAADRLYLNDGKGGFNLTSNALPDITTNSMAVASADINRDGMPDLFIGSGASSGTYPISDRHYLLINDFNSSDRFLDHTEKISSDLDSHRGIINDAAWVDLNGDATLELVTAGDWEPLRLYQLEGGKLTDKTSVFGLHEIRGLWTSLSIADINGDGRPDIIAGNFGDNALFEANEEHPMRIYYGDLTGDGFFDSIPSRFALANDGRLKEFPYHYRSDFMRHMPGLMGVYPTHEKFGNATIEDIKSHLSGNVRVKEINNLKSTLFINGLGDKLSMKLLPEQAQFSPVFDALHDNLNSSSESQLFIVGNLRGGDVYSGSYNAMHAFIFDVGGGSSPLSLGIIPLGEAGIHLKGYARSIYKVGNRAGKDLYATVYDTGDIQLFERIDSSKVKKTN